MLPASLKVKMNNKILALKYRPQEFRDLIGQEIITQTVRAIKTYYSKCVSVNGIRGVGKTTTARLIAKALIVKNTNEKLNAKMENSAHM